MASGCLGRMLGACHRDRRRDRNDRDPRTRFRRKESAMLPISQSPATDSPAAHDQAVPRWHRIYIGMLTQVMPHPNADHEVVVEVDAGWGCLTVVTGGPRV